MFAKILALCAVIAVAFAAPKPEPSPQYYYNAAGLDYVSPYFNAYPSIVSPYAAAPLAYSSYPASPYYVRK